MSASDLSFIAASFVVLNCWLNDLEPMTLSSNNVPVGRRNSRIGYASNALGAIFRMKRHFTLERASLAGSSESRRPNGLIPLALGL